MHSFVTFPHKTCHVHFFVTFRYIRIQKNEMSHAHPIVSIAYVRLCIGRGGGGLRKKYTTRTCIVCNMGISDSPREWWDMLMSGIPRSHARYGRLISPRLNEMSTRPCIWVMMDHVTYLMDKMMKSLCIWDMMCDVNVRYWQLDLFSSRLECCSVLQCVAVCCRVLQCVAVCCSVLQLDLSSSRLE